MENYSLKIKNSLGYVVLVLFPIVALAVEEYPFPEPNFLEILLLNYYVPTIIFMALIPVICLTSLFLLRKKSIFKTMFQALVLILVLTGIVFMANYLGFSIFKM